ncbi:MAG: hypothetical protein DRP84_10130 [Spirochaetes bacterium]|nr:MAG: hypothetical protein DRP84_10130 [Spirochaetota bacterium]
MKEFVMKYKDLEIYNVGNAIQRFKERFSQYSIGTFKKLLRRGVEEVDKLCNLRPDEYMLIYSKRDLKIPFEITDIGKIFTVLEISEHPIDLKDAIKVIVEAIIRYDLPKEEIIELLKELNINPPEYVVMNLASKYKMTIIDSMDNTGYHFFIEEGKPYKTWTEIYIYDEEDEK